MKRSRLFSLMAIVLCLAVTMPSCKLHKIQPTVEEEDEDETPPSTQPAETMVVNALNQFISDGAPYEEIISISESTPAPTTAPMVMVPAPAGMTGYSKGDMTYAVTNEWTFAEQDIYHYFFVDVNNGSNSFMMVFTEDSTVPNMDETSYQSYMSSFNKQFVMSLEDGKMISEEVHTEGDLLVSNSVFEGTDEGVGREVTIHSCMNPETGSSYYFVLVISKADAEIEDDILAKYNESLATVRIGDPIEMTTYTLSKMTYSVPSDWHGVEEEDQHFFLPDTLDDSIFLMTYATPSGMNTQMNDADFRSYIDMLNDQFVGNMGNGVLVKNEVHTDAYPYYADVVYDGIYNNDMDCVMTARYYVDEQANGYYLMMVIEKDADEGKAQTAEMMYSLTLASVTFAE